MQGEKIMSKNNKLKILLCMLIVSALAFTAAFGLGGCAGGDGGSSETNNQTAGVDESDIVKVTDDGYIFKAQTDGLTVSSAIDGAIQVVFSTGYVNYTPSEMFVTDDLLILFGNKRVPISGTSAFSTKTEIKFFNIAALKNNSAGYTLRTSEFNGSFYTARMFDNQVFVTMKLNYYSHQNNLFELYYDSYEGIKTLDFAEELLDRDEEGKIITPKSYDGFIIAKYNLGNITASALTAKYYAGESVSDVYCSPYAIYTISAHVRRTGPARGCGVRSTEHFTKITRISLSDLTVKNSLEYQGTVLNRYSLYDNGLVFFFVGSSGGYNYVYSYDNNFKKLGQSADFARWEDVHAVRFSGEEELCYVVTFRQVDPLFKIDISNPLNIRILGELKIDGYSTHLQTFGDGYLMGLGFDGDSWGLTGGIKLSLFGVTDNDPVELDSVVFGKILRLSLQASPRLYSASRNSISLLSPPRML